MLFENIALQSAGSLAIAVVALLIFILQALFFFRKPQLTWYAWGAAISFSALLYSVSIFIEYNAPQGWLNRFAGLFEYTAVICMIHSAYGFTFSYLGIESKKYHPIAGVFHAFILILLWSNNLIVSEKFTARNFLSLKSPYIEAALGPFGPIFVLYTTIASIIILVLWFKHKEIDLKYRKTYIAGVGFWIILGIHDGLASLGMPTLQYFMEYGFLGFAMAVLYAVFDRHMDIAAEEKYRIITELAHDCIMVIQDGKLVFGNPACCDLIGLPLTESTPQDILDLIVEEDRKKVTERYNHLIKNNIKINPFTVRIKKKESDEKFVEITSSIILYKNRPAVIVIMRDITERIQEEFERQENEKKLARLKKMESLGLLAGGVAHDLNNVLSSITSYPEIILLELPEDSKFLKHIQAIQQAGNRAVAIVQDLLTLARRGVEINEVVNLNNIIRNYLKSPEFQKLKSFHPGVEVELSLDSILLNVNGSSIHLSKTVMNLVSNAAEAITGAGKIIISTECLYIDKTVKGYDEIAEGDYVILRVSDTGSGISSDDRERIFEPFYTKKVMGRSGTGLGLSVVWGTVKDHNGYIDIESVEGKGTTFILYFPATRKELLKDKDPISLDSYKGDGEKILVVDDVESQRDIASMMLTKLDYSVAVVSSGEKAIEYIKNNSIDLLVLDMIMDPGMDGLDTYKQILKIKPGQKAIIASGFSETGRVKEAQELGAGQYVKKPYTLEKIGMAVRNELKKTGN